MRIGQLANATGVTAKSLRFYEAEGLLPERARTPAGYRDYTPEATVRVGFIRRAQAAGLTLGQIGQVLAIRDDGHPPCGHVAVLVGQRLDEIAHRMAELEATRTELLALRERLDQLDPADCTDDEVCAVFSTHGRHASPAVHMFSDKPWGEQPGGGSSSKRQSRREGDSAARIGAQ